MGELRNQTVGSAGKAGLTMSEPTRERPGWPRWMTVLAIVITLATPLVIFWEQVAVFVCMQMLRSKVTFRQGLAGLKWLGPRGVPYLIPYVRRDTTTAVGSRYYDAAASVVVDRWSDLTAEDVELVAPHLFSVSLDARDSYQAGRPVSYILNLCPLVVPYTWWRTWPKWVETVELLEAGRPVAAFRMHRRVMVWGREPQPWLMPLDPEMSWVQKVPEAREMVERLQQPGQHTLRVSLALVDDRLSEPVPVAQFTQVIHTVEALPSGSFAAVSDPVTDAKMKQAISVKAGLAADRSTLPLLVLKHQEVPFTIEKRTEPPMAFAGRAVVRIRETGEEFDGGGHHWESIVPGQPFTCTPVRWMVEDLPLEPGRTYHLQVVYKSDPEAAWLDPRITEYWDGEITSNWVEVTVPSVDER